VIFRADFYRIRWETANAIPLETALAGLADA